MNKEILALIFNAMFSNIKDAKSLLLYALTALVTTFIYMIVANQTQILDFAQNFSRNTVLQQEKTQRIIEYPNLAKERAAMLYAQSNSDAVFIAEYKPKFINNYQDIIAWEGAVTVDPSKILNSVIDRTSGVYQEHVLGKNVGYSFAEGAKWSMNNFITSGEEYRSIGISYLYTCPIYNLNNSYSGYIGIGYVKVPYSTLEEKELLEDYLSKVCTPHSRALGRKK